MPRQNGGRTLGGVETAFNIVAHLRESGPATVTELADGLDMPKSTVHIHLKTMTEAGYLARDSEKYTLSLRFLEHGIAVRKRFDLYEIAAPEIDDLARQTRNVASLGVEEEGKRVLLYKSEVDGAVYDNAQTGEFTHMHWTSLGKAILAHLPSERVDQIVATHGLPGATGNTITDRTALADELERIREQGYALEDEERRERIRAVGIPILADDRPVGAIAVSGPKARLTDEYVENDLLGTLREKADVIELKLEHY